MSCNAAFIQQEGHFTVLSANTGLRASVGSHTARVVGTAHVRHLPGSWNALAELGASNDWCNEAAV